MPHTKPETTLVQKTLEIPGHTSCYWSCDDRVELICFEKPEGVTAWVSVRGGMVVLILTGGRELD